MEPVHDVMPSHLPVVRGAVLHHVLIANFLEVMGRLEQAHSHCQALAGSNGEELPSRTALIKILAVWVSKREAGQCSHRLHVQRGHVQPHDG